MKHRINSIIYLFIALCIFSSGCKEKKQIPSMNLFSIKKNISGTLLIDDSKLLNPCSIQIIDSIIIIANSDNDTFLEIHNINSGEKLKNFLLKGSGPEEFLYIGYIQTDKENNFYVSDFMSQKFFKYNMKQVLDSLHPTAVHLRNANKIPLEGTLLSNCYKSKYGTIIQNLSDKGRICIVDNDSISFFGNYPPIEAIDDKLTAFNNAKLYQSIATVNPKGNQIALACTLGDMLDVYSISLNRIDSIWSYRNAYPNDVIVMTAGNQQMAGSTSKSIYHYLDLCSSDKYIYALHSGKTIKDKLYTYGNHIRIVSWDKSKSLEIETEDMLRAIAVSSDDKVIYGVSLTDNGYEIVKYSLYGIL